MGERLWEVIVREDGLGLPAKADRAGSPTGAHSWTASHPGVLAPSTASTPRQPYAQQVKPGNFLLVAHVAPGGHPPGADPKNSRLSHPTRGTPALGPNCLGETSTTRTGRPTALSASRSSTVAAGRFRKERLASRPTPTCLRLTAATLRRNPLDPTARMFATHHRPALSSAGPGALRRPRRQGVEPASTKYRRVSSATKPRCWRPTRPKRRPSLPRFVVPALKALPAKSLADVSGLPLRTVQVCARRSANSP